MKALNPKPKTRNPKEGRNPKSEGSRQPHTIHSFGFRPSGFAQRHAFMLTEALVYIGVIFVLLGIGYIAMYRCIDNSVALRRNADDIVGALHAGERWRADVRLASGGVRLDNSGEPLLRLECATNRIEYRFSSGSLYRRTGEGPWSKVLDRVESSSMERDSRPTVTVWRWELALRSQGRGSFKPGRVRPLFTFLAVPPAAGTP